MRHLPANDEDDAHLTLQPWPGHRKSGPVRHRGRKNPHRRRRRIVTAGVAIIAAVAIAAGVSLYNKSANPTKPTGPLPVHLPTTPGSYLGLFMAGVPASYAGVRAFTNATGARPDVVMYYSGWYMPFPLGFATTAADNGAVPLVQMNPSKQGTKISIADIASGRYDAYLSAYAEAVRAYGHPVILSFGHEMNGPWYQWGYTHTSPTEFVAAWRHIVTLFRALGARNVTWLWTINIVNNTQDGRIPPPASWWPGSSYVNWVGIDGYYLQSSWQFDPLFGPTIAQVHELTSDPILIAETGVTPAADQPAKIADVFAGIHLYGLLGFVYFDATNYQGLNFSISSPAAVAAFRQGASTFTRPTS
jgi:mannan endo-1,4-beta-mannosidase